MISSAKARELKKQYDDGTIIGQIDDAVTRAIEYQASHGRNSLDIFYVTPVFGDDQFGVPNFKGLASWKECKKFFEYIEPMKELLTKNHYSFAITDEKSITISW